MKIEQLRESVSALGFENGIYDERLFILSADRALSMIFTDREVLKEAVIDTGVKKPSVFIGSYIHSGEVTTFRISGKAYSFRASGTGSYTVKDKTGERMHDISGDGGVYRGFISGDATITFSGEYRFSVYDLASFDILTGPEESDIPQYSREIKIDLKKRIPDLLTSISIPTDNTGVPIKGARAVGGILTLPSDTEGEIKLIYRRSPKKIYSDMTEDIDLPPECESLLPFLTASFMWLEDDADMAQYYMALYKSALSTVKSELLGRLDTEYKTNGWA